MKHIDLKGKLPKDCEIWHLGDFHVGAAGFSERVLKRYLKAIAENDDIFYSLGGDMIDSMSPQDPRFKFGQTGGKYERASDQVDYVLKLLTPIREKCLWAIHGNHEMRIWNTMDAIKELVFRLKGDEPNPYGIDLADCLHYHPGAKAWMSQVCVKAEFDTFKLYDHHAPGLRVNSRAGRKKRRKQNEMETIYRYLRDLGGSQDCIGTIGHHCHKIYPISPDKSLTTISVGKTLKAVYPNPIKKHISKNEFYYDDEERWYGTSGGFFGGYVEGITTYVEFYGHPPVEMGCIKTVVKKGEFQGLFEVKL